MISHSPTRLPMTISRLGQLIRFASTSFGTSTPAAVASDSRRVLRNPFCERAMRSVSGSRVERCRRVSTAWIVWASRTRQVAATARSTPTTTAAAATAAARSRSVRGRGRGRGTPEVAQQRPFGVIRTVSGLSAPWAIPALRSRSTERKKHVDVVVADLVRRRARRAGAVGQPCDEGRVVGRSASPGRDDLGDERAGVRGQERQVGLVLHLLQPVEQECRARVAVDAEAPDLAQPLRFAASRP